ncbi:hypothetical protein [Flindersiella endophytica]
MNDERDHRSAADHAQALVDKWIADPSGSSAFTYLMQLARQDSGAFDRLVADERQLLLELLDCVLGSDPGSGAEDRS